MPGMSAITFNTYKFVERLEQAGASRELAAALAESQAQSLAEALDTTLATKADTTAIRADMREMKAELMGEMRLTRWMLAMIIVAEAAPLLKTLFN